MFLDLLRRVTDNSSWLLCNASLRLALTAVASFATLALGCNSGGTTTVTGPVPDFRADPFLDTVETRTFRWFWETTNPTNGLVPDRWPTKSFSSVAAIGFGLTAYVVGAERGYVPRADARTRVRTTLDFLYHAPQSANPTGLPGDKGFLYHFLDLDPARAFQTSNRSRTTPSYCLAAFWFSESIS